MGQKHLSNPSAKLYNRSKGSPGWSQAYTLRAYLSGYRVKKDTKWLDCMVVRTDNLFDQARDVPDWPLDRLGAVSMVEPLPQGVEYWPGYKDGFRGWGSAKYMNQYHEFMVHDGHVCAPVAQFVKWVYSDPALHKKYKAKADEYLKTLEEHIIAKWYKSWDAKRGTDTCLALWGGWRNLPHNQYLAFGTVLTIMHEIASAQPSGGPGYVPSNNAFPDFYLREATAMAQFFKDDLRYSEKEDAYLWDYMKHDQCFCPSAGRH